MSARKDRGHFASSVGIDSVAMEAAAGRVLFALAEWHRHEIATGRGDRQTLRFGNAAIRHVICLWGNVELETASGVIRLAPGGVWVSAGERVAGRMPFVFRQRNDRDGKGDVPILLEFVFAPPLAAEYAEFLARNFGRVVQLPTDGAAWRAAQMLERAAVAGESREVMSGRIFAWLTALHETLEERQVHLRDLLRGRIDHLLPECMAHGYSVKALATYLGCSPAWLAGQLRHAWRRPAGEVLHALRYRHAWALLNSLSLDVEETGRLCGFGSVSSFVTGFRRACGITPARARGKPVPRSLQASASAADMRASLTEKQKQAEDALFMAGGNETTVAAAMWSGPYFQFDGGVSEVMYAHPYDLAINTITNAVHWVLTLEGEAVFECGNHSLTLKPGMVLIHPQPLNARLATDGELPWKRLWIKVRGEWGVEALTALGIAHGWVARVPLSSRPVQLAREWVAYWSSHRGEPSIVGSRAAYEWFLEWWRFLCIHGNGLDTMDERLPDLMPFLSRSFFRRIKTIEGYAAEIGYSREHTSRKLRAQWTTGTPAQVIRRHRLAQSALDLKHTRMSVAEIAQRARYASAGTFIVAFKKRYGKTPLAWRLGTM